VPEGRLSLVCVNADYCEQGGIAMLAIHESAAGRGGPQGARRMLLAGILGLAAATMVYGQWRDRQLQMDVKQLRDAVAHAREDERQFRGSMGRERLREGEERKRLEDLIADARAREERLGLLTIRRLAEEKSARADGLERAAGERIIRDFAGGVALIEGRYAFYDAEGAPLRESLDDDGQPRRQGDGSLVLSPEASGPVFTQEFFGTGFLVDRRGLLLTNRHVAEPWWNDATAQRLRGEGMEPRFAVFRAFFPNEAEPFELSTERVSETVDLAVVRLDLRDRPIPVLALDMTGQGAIPGRPVVLVGYPTGLDAILAKADSSVVRQILSEKVRQPVTESLGKAGLIRPSATQGHIGDVTGTDVVFDAPTTQGGSGGPVLNRSGKVIAVEYAVLTTFAGTSFGVPIGHALELLESR
jgi:S1-C subfamily serine protease